MKKILLSFLAIVLVNCNAIGGGDDYEINGKIKNSSQNSIYLEKVSHTEIKLIDSSVLKNGNFSMKGPIEGLGFYRLRLKADNPQGGLFWFFSLERGEKIMANLDLKAPMNYSLTGGDNQKEFQDIIKNLTLHQNEIMQLYQQYNVAAQKNPNSDEVEELKKQINGKNETFNKYVTNVIQSSKNLMSKYYLYSVLLQQFQNTAIPDQLAQDLKMYSDVLSKELPNSMYAKDFQNVVTNIDQQKKMAEAKAKLGIGAMAPDVELAKEDGTKVKLSSFRGKIVLMDFWASWCRPCRMENPNVVKAYHKFKNRDFVVLSITQDRDLNKWKAAIAMDKLIWNTHYADKLAGNQASLTYDVSYIPKTYLIDKDGKIAATDLRGDALESAIERLTSK